LAVALFVRSAVFNAAFYLTTLAYLLVAVPTFFMPRRGILEVAKHWGRTNVWLLRVICGIRVEWRGVDKIPPGPLIVAAKHQSAWETFALLSQFDDPTFILKRELQWIPVWGWLAAKARMIPVDRGAGAHALSAMAQRARVEMTEGRQLIIFPEGTRMAPGAKPRYKFGVSFLYSELAVPCVPVALNSGLFWPRRSFRRFPGTIRVEFLDPIPPGLPREVFSARLQEVIESATSRLIAEGARELSPDNAGLRVAPGEQ
jgi:1-acyl-sn-glycerol-3-phosphate acyltransferase